VHQSQIILKWNWQKWCVIRKTRWKKDFDILGDCDRSDWPALKATWLNACPLSIRTNCFAVITAKSILYHLKVNWGNKVGIYNDADSAFSESDHFQKTWIRYFTGNNSCEINSSKERYLYIIATDLVFIQDGFVRVLTEPHPMSLRGVM
jgi:hypothetical protein